MRALLLTLLVGCATEPTVGDFVDDWAESTCSRQVRCGFTKETPEQCELGSHEFFCKNYDCGREYSPPQSVTDCLRSYESASCDDPIPLCRFP